MTGKWLTINRGNQHSLRKLVILWLVSWRLIGHLLAGTNLFFHVIYLAGKKWILIPSFSHLFSKNNYKMNLEMGEVDGGSGALLSYPFAFHGPQRRYQFIGLSFQPPKKISINKRMSGWKMKETQSCYPGTWALRLILVTDPSSSGKQDWWMHVMALLLFPFHLPSPESQ